MKKRLDMVEMIRAGTKVNVMCFRCAEGRLPLVGPVFHLGEAMAKREGNLACGDDYTIACKEPCRRNETTKGLEL